MVGRTSEEQGCVAQVLAEWPVNNSVDLSEDAAERRVALYLLDGETCVEPYIEAQGLDCAAERYELVNLIERVSARNCDVETILFYVFNYFVHLHISAGIERPRLRVVASGALVLASGKVDRGAQARAVDNGAVDNIDYAEFICARHGR